MMMIDRSSMCGFYTFEDYFAQVWDLGNTPFTNAPDTIRNDLAKPETENTMFNSFNRPKTLTLISFALIMALVVGLFVNASPSYAQGPDRGGRGGRNNAVTMVARAVLDATVKVTGLTRLEVTQQWAAGKTLTQIITEKGSSVDAVKAEAKTTLTDAITKAQTNGRLSQEQADKQLAELDAALDKALTITFAEAGAEARTRLQDMSVDLAVMQATIKTTGLERQALITQLSAEGATFASVITANGKTVAEVKAAAKETLTTRITDAVSKGRLTQAEADTMLAGLDAALDKTLNGGLPEALANRGRGDNNRAETLIGLRATGALIEETAKQTGLTQREVLQELRDGKTLSQIAQSKSIDAKAIVAATVTTVTEQINQAVKAGRLTQAQADETLKTLEQTLTELMDKTNPLQGNRQGRGGRGNP
jgi:DNA-binding NarL/FixJ family response regulator